MLLLTLFAFFFLFLAIALAFALFFQCWLKKNKKILVIDSHKNCMCFVETSKSCTHCKNIRILKIVSIFFVLFTTWGTYSLTGNPGIKSYFFSELMNKDPNMLNKHEQLVRLQALFFRTPNDGKLTDALAVGYLEEGHFQSAVNVYLDSLRLNGESAPRLVGYGLALVGYEGGIITQEAQNAFQKAANLAPHDFYPYLLLADSLRQAGQSTQAAQLLQNFLDTVPKDFSGRSHIERMIAQFHDSFN